MELTAVFALVPVGLWYFVYGNYWGSPLAEIPLKVVVMLGLIPLWWMFVFSIWAHLNSPSR